MQPTKHSITERIDAVTGIPASHLSTVLPPPKSCKIELTANCNYKCSFCVKSLRPDNGEIDRKFYSRIIREMRNYGVEELGVFFIGESFLCQGLPEAIKEAKDVGYPYVFLTTNGSAVNEKKLRRCMESGLDSLKFSLNFYEASQLAKIAKVSEANFDKAIEGVKTRFSHETSLSHRHSRTAIPIAPLYHRTHQATTTLKYTSPGRQSHDAFLTAN